MSMQPVPWPEPDPQIAAAIKAMYGSRKTERPLAVEIRDRLGQWLADEDFAAAFGIRGRPGWAPSRLALVTVLQRAEKLTDRLAAEAVRARLDWKYLLGLADRQSQMIPSEDPDYGDLGPAFPAWTRPGRAPILQPPKPEIPSSPRILDRVMDRDADWEAAD